MQRRLKKSVAYQTHKGYKNKHKKEVTTMYGIFTMAGALLTSFRANTFDQAMAIMGDLISRKPILRNRNLVLSKIA